MPLSAPGPLVGSSVARVSIPLSWPNGAKERASAERSALEPRKRGPKPVPTNPLQAENTKLKREKAQLQKKLRTAELMIEIQKKVAEILGITLPVMGDDEENS